MLREMTEQQFVEWIAYYQIEPFGILAHDAEWAHWKSIYTNAHMKKGKQAIKTEKFLLYGEKDKDASDIYDDEDEDL